jgi:hypothetical protein
MANILPIEDIYNVLVNNKYIDLEGGITLNRYERESLISWIVENGYAVEAIDNEFQED